ncbi:MAG: hypothetical protein ACKOF9_12235 [Burkholderiales bacterium]
MVMIGDKTQAEKEKTLPAPHFDDIIERPVARLAAQKAVAKRTAAYE